MNSRFPEEPPVLLDGARVLEYAALSGAAPVSDAMHGLAAGVPLAPGVVSRLVIAENLVEDGVFLIHCDAEWGTVIGESYPDAQAARVAAGESYGGESLEWLRFRELTAREAREVETTRAFLREITAEFPPD